MNAAGRVLGVFGWLAFFAWLTQSCASAPKAAKAVNRGEAVVAHVLAAADKTCDKSVPACAVYFDAVRGGFMPDDDRAELACAKVSAVCALVAPDAGAAGAP